MIDINKQYTTRSGCETRIYATDGCRDWPIHGAVKTADGMWVSRVWTSTGSASSVGKHDWDLIEAKPRIKGWLNVYRNCSVYLYSTREAADMGASPNRIACIEIDVPHGYGLEETT